MSKYFLETTIGGPL